MIKLNTLGIKGISQKRLVVKYIPTLDIMPNEYNPNTHETKSFDLLIKSICLFGFTQPIVVDKKTMTIIDGENRWRVACVLDMEDVPVVFMDLSDEEMKLATIIHNEARGKHTQISIDKISDQLKTKGIDLNKELLKTR